MEDLLIFTDDLSVAEKKRLLALFSERQTLPCRILGSLLEGKTDRGEIERESGATRSFFNKSLTQAKQELIAEIKKGIETPYDEIYLLKKMILSGHFDVSLKMINQLEKQYELKQQWQNLELLYVEASRLCQATGKLTLGKKISLLRVKNARRLTLYISLSARLNDLLFEFEVYEKKKIAASFLAQTKGLLADATESKHYTLIHNALQIQYLYYSRYTNETAIVKKLAEKIFQNQKKHARQLNEVTSVLALNVYVNYVSIYSGDIPKNVLSYIHQHISLAGKHALFNFHYALLDHHLFSGSYEELDSLLATITPITDNTKFTVYRNGILAIKAFSENNIPLFKDYFKKFYENPARLDFPEEECFLRILEAVHQIKEKKEEVLYKLNALRVFADRNLSERYLYERKVIAFLLKYTNQTVSFAQMQAFLLFLERSPYRNMRFLKKIFEQEIPLRK